MRIIEKIKSRIEADRPFWSFEYFPPQTEAGLHNLYARIERMAQLQPVFVDITWGAGGSTSEKTLGIASTLQKYFGLDVLMHLTCTNMPLDRIDRALDQARQAGIRNILALRGDPPRGTSEWQRIEDGLEYAYQLVEHIRKRFDDEFCIGVAGYPEGHLEAPDKETCTAYLKHKVECGADFVITQLFFDVDEYFDFLDRCERHGIDCPIIPGLLPIQNYDRFQKFAKFTGVKVPPDVDAALEPIKQDDAQVKEYGIELCIDMVRRMRERGVPGFHFYTLNLQSSVTRILEGLEFTDDLTSERPLPWRPSTHPDRRQEDVRPIFWSNRPKSYLARTMDWDDFPNGRWGDRRSPTFGTLKDYYLLRRGIGLEARDEELRESWGTPESTDDVFDVFRRFCAGELDTLPWVDGQLQAETRRIVDELVELNRAGYLTINSQPQVNGAPSSDPDVGWGGPGGIVYQKAYLEMFLSRERLERFLEIADGFPTLTYQAVNAGGETHGNVDADAVNAVTWGIFPGEEIIQPTVVDCQSFLTWKDEAFQIWIDQWAVLYEPGSQAREVLHRIHDTYFLLNIVENDFIGGDIFAVFRRLGALEQEGVSTGARNRRGNLP